MPSLLYDRKVSIYRSSVQSDPVEGLHQKEATVLLDVDANIQLVTERGTQPKVYAGPTDSVDTVSLWNIHIPASQAKLGDILKSDKIVDELGNAYKVDAPYWTAFGHQLQCRDYNP